MKTTFNRNFTEGNNLCHFCHIDNDCWKLAAKFTPVQLPNSEASYINLRMCKWFRDYYQFQKIFWKNCCPCNDVTTFINLTLTGGPTRFCIRAFFCQFFLDFLLHLLVSNKSVTNFVFVFFCYGMVVILIFIVPTTRLWW